MQFCSEEFSLSTGHAAAPAALTPGVAVKAEYSAVTDLFLGSKVAFTLTVGFPAGVTSGVIVEILPSTNVTIMAVGSVNMTRGANLDIDPNTKLVYHPSEESKDVSCFFLFIFTNSLKQIITCLFFYFGMFCDLGFFKSLIVFFLFGICCVLILFYFIIYF